MAGVEKLRRKEADVRTVLVDGKVVMEEGVIQTLDEPTTLDRNDDAIRPRAPFCEKFIELVD